LVEAVVIAVAAGVGIVERGASAFMTARQPVVAPIPTLVAAAAAVVDVGLRVLARVLALATQGLSVFAAAGFHRRRPAKGDRPGSHTGQGAQRLPS
jgi:hypothetical protein